MAVLTFDEAINASWFRGHHTEFHGPALASCAWL